MRFDRKAPLYSPSNAKGGNWWNIDVQKVAEEFQTALELGLTDSAASERLKKWGLNSLPKGKKRPFIALFFKQFLNFIIWVLIGASIISAFLQEYIDAIVIGAIIVLNALIASFQEYRAETSLAALRKLTPFSNHLLRGGTKKVVASEKIVPGDLLFLEAGDLVPADGRIVDCSFFTTQEASLTGESVPVHKHSKILLNEELSIGDRKNMVFAGTEVASGNAKVIVTATGFTSELGKIALLLGEPKEEMTPLEVRMEKLGRTLVYFCLATVLIIFVLGVLKGESWLEMLLVAASLAVAAIPEGLPAIVTTALAIGASRMAKRKALVRRLPSVETLGCTSVICTDKTGTLTKNEMNVKVLWVDGQFIEVSGEGYVPEGEFKRYGLVLQPKQEPFLRLLLQAAALCNRAHLSCVNGHWNIMGDPTEGALLALSGKAGINQEALKKDFELLGEIPFDSERKRMSVLFKEQNEMMLFVKGAPDIVMRLSDEIYLQGQKHPLSGELKIEFQKAIESLSTRGFRVLAFAERKEGLGEAIDASMENKLTLIGLAAMSDPARPEVADALVKCAQAGILPVMITGDHKETALAIARDIGLLHAKSVAVEGLELDLMNDEGLDLQIADISVYARVSAENKLRIIRAWKKKGAIVAMTGDGVNDAPAVKEADIGIAMGIKGADVTKEAADMVITDDHFASIVNAVEEGRGIYDNIVKFVGYLLTSNFAEILVIFIGILMTFTDPEGNPFVPLIPVQILFLNLVTDGFPAIALALDPLDPEAMQRAPRHPKSSLLFSKNLFQFVLISLLITAAALVMCSIGLRSSAQKAHTLTLTILVLLELVKVQMVRAKYNMGFFSNPWLTLALISSLGMQLLVVYVPFFQRIFGTIALDGADWVIILSIFFLVWILGGVISLIFKWLEPKKLNP